MNLMKSSAKLVKAIERHDMQTVKDYLTSLEATAKWTEKIRKSEGPTPLYVAAYNNNVDAIELLLAHGADIHQTNLSGATALLGAFSQGATEAIQALLCHGARADQDRNREFYEREAIEDGIKFYHYEENGNDKILDYCYGHLNVDDLKTVIDRGADLDSTNFLSQLCLRPELFPLYGPLLEKGIKPEENKVFLKQGLAYAICGKNTAVIEDLTARGIKCNSDALTELAKLPPDRFDIYRLLDAKGAIPEDFGQPTSKILQAAVTANNLEFLKSVAAKGVDINAMDTNNTTVLHYAIERRSVEAVQILADIGARMDIYNHYKYTALALASGHAEDAEHNSAEYMIYGILRKKHDAEKHDSDKAIAPQPKDEWERISDSEVSRIIVIKASQKRITEIFNFEAKQRMTIIDDLASRAQGFMPREDFSDIPLSSLRSAFDAYRRLEGPKTETEALSVFMHKDNAFFKNTPDNGKTGGMS